jgi:hypothetical protein
MLKVRTLEDLFRLFSSRRVARGMTFGYHRVRFSPYWGLQPIFPRIAETVTPLSTRHRTLRGVNTKLSDALVLLVSLLLMMLSSWLSLR